MSQPVQIIRYKNRKLYSRTLSVHVTLSDIRDLIKDGKSVQVTDNESGADITVQTLGQVLSSLNSVPVSKMQELIVNHN